MEKYVMPTLFQRTKELAVLFRERCGRLCDSAYRRAALRERMLLQELWVGVRV